MGHGKNRHRSRLLPTWVPASKCDEKKVIASALEAREALNAMDAAEMKRSKKFVGARNHCRLLLRGVTRFCAQLENTSAQAIKRVVSVDPAGSTNLRMALGGPKRCCGNCIRQLPTPLVEVARPRSSIGCLDRLIPRAPTSTGVRPLDSRLKKQSRRRLRCSLRERVFRPKDSNLEWREPRLRASRWPWHARLLHLRVGCSDTPLAQR